MSTSEPVQQMIDAHSGANRTQRQNHIFNSRPRRIVRPRPVQLPMNEHANYRIETSQSQQSQANQQRTPQQAINQNNSVQSTSNQNPSGQPRVNKSNENQHLTILGQHSSVQNLQRAKRTDLEDVNTVRGQKLNMLREHLSGLTKARFQKLVLILMISGTNLYWFFGLKLDEQDQCEILTTIEEWYKAWIEVSFLIYIALGTIKCIVSGQAVSVKLIRKLVNTILLFANPLQLLFVGYGVSLMSKVSPWTQNKDQCADVDFFESQKVFSIISIVAVVLEIIHLVSELCFVIVDGKGCLCLCCDRDKQFDEDEKQYEEAWEARKAKISALNQHSKTNHKSNHQRFKKLALQYFHTYIKNEFCNKKTRVHLKQFIHTECVTKTNKKSINQNKDLQISDCSICMGSFEPNQKTTSLPCDPMHIFHYDCILQWLEKKTECPLCRKDFKENVKFEVEYFIRRAHNRFQEDLERILVELEEIEKFKNQQLEQHAMDDVETLNQARLDDIFVFKERIEISAEQSLKYAVQSLRKSEPNTAVPDSAESSSNRESCSSRQQSSSSSSEDDGDSQNENAIQNGPIINA